MTLNQTRKNKTVSILCRGRTRLEKVDVPVRV